MNPALGVDPLHGRDARERAASAVVRHFELEPGNIVRGLAGSIARGLCTHGAAVDMLPVRSGIVTSDGLAVELQRRDRLPECPCELAVVTGLALVDLRAFRVERRHHA